MVLLVSVALGVECQGDCTERGRSAETPEQAVELWTRGCEQAEPESCLELSDALLYGRGVRNDHSRANELRELALRHYELACRKGDGEACTLVASYRESSSWDVLACGADQVQGCATLAKTDGRYLEKACRLGDERSCTRWEKALWEEALSTDDRARAADLYEQLTEIFPSSERAPLALWNLANAQWDLGRIKPAIASWEAFLARYPSHDKAPEALERIARAHESLNQLEQARAAREQLELSYPEYGAVPPPTP